MKIDYNNLKYKDTDETVNLLHYGFDIVVVEHKNGRQELLKPSDVGLSNRTRPTTMFGKKYI